jgi:hypothetical protein
MLFLGYWGEKSLKPPRKGKVFCPVFDVGKAYTRLHGFKVPSYIIKILRGKYKDESYWFQAVQHIKLYGFQAAKRLTLPDIADCLVWLQSMILTL